MVRLKKHSSEVQGIVSDEQVSVEKFKIMNDVLKIKLAGILASNKKSYKLIDQFYEKNKMECMKVVSENKDILSKEEIVQCGSIEQAEYMFKAFSIIELDATDKYILKMIQKAYPEAYNYVNSATTVALTKLFDKVFKKNDLHAMDLISYGICAINLSFILKKDLDFEDEVFIDIITDILGPTYMSNMYKGNSSRKFSYSVLDRKAKKLVDDIERNVRTNYLKAGYRASSCLPLEEGLGVLDRKVKAFTLADNLNETQIEQITTNMNPLSANDIKDLIACYLYTREGAEVESARDIDYIDLVSFLLPTMSLRYYSKEYKRVKKKYLDRFSNDPYIEINKKTKEIDELKLQNEKLQQQINELLNENEVLSKSNKKLVDEVKIFDVIKMERNALIDRVYSDEQNLEDNTIDDTLSSIIKVEDVAVFGGHPKWINKLKDKVPCWTFVPVDSLNFDPNIVKNNKYILVNTAYNSHGMYYKISNLLTENNKLCFINTTNIERLLNESFK